MKYVFIATHASEFRVQALCRALGVGRSGYYAWRNRPVSPREQEQTDLVAHITQQFEHSRRTYGSPRIHAALKRQGIHCGRKQVAHLMRVHHLVARRKRAAHPVTTRRRAGTIPAPNLLNQDFSAQARNEKWVTDITYIDTTEGWLYLASVMDLYSRRVVGWALADHMETSLIEAALLMALATRKPPAGLLHHSDQGSQYTSWAYLVQLAAHKCQVSMSRTGNCYDNAAMESFHATLKTECVVGQFATHAQARRVIFEYIEVWYNRQRLHSALGYLSPAEFEAKAGN
jgi:putative transposase